MIVDILKRTRALVEEGWCKEVMWQNENGHIQSRCFYGAYLEARSDILDKHNVNFHRQVVNEEVFNALRDELPDGFGSLVAFNDARATTKADVLAVIDRTIAKQMARAHAAA